MFIPFQIVDDAGRNIFDSVGFVEVVAHGFGAVILVHNVTFGDQCGHFGILRVRDWRLGLVKGQMEHRYGKLSDITWRHRVLLHIANLFANTRR